MNERQAGWPHSGRLAPSALFVLGFLAAACGGPATREAQATPPPSFTAQGIAATPAEPQGEPVPGMIVSLYGQHLGPETACTAGPLREGEAHPLELCETRVLVGERAAELLYVQQSQINLRIPPETPAGVASEVRVVFQGRSSPPVPVLISQRRPLAVLQDVSPQSEALWNALESAPWEASFQAWRQQNPDPACQRFQGEIGLVQADEQWCHRCTSESELQNIEWSFYAWDPAAPASRLGQFHAHVEGVAEQTVVQIYDGLRRLLARRHGMADDPGSVPARGAGYWQKLRRWRVEGREIYLYIGRPPFEPAHLGLLVRTQPLFDALAEDPILWTAGEAKQLQPGQELDRELSQALQNHYPGLRAVLNLPAATSGSEVQPQPIYEMALRLLEDTAAAPSERGAAMLLAADRLADRLNPLFIPPVDPSQQLAEVAEMQSRLKGFGVEYESGYDATGNTGNLLRHVWESHGGTRWGEWAFLLLHLRGWTSGFGCRHGDENFRDVITRGEAFLAGHPASPHRRDVMFATAQAHETWWSLSQAPPDGDGIDSARYREGSERARERAVHWYRAILAGQPSTPQAAYARRELPRLELGLDTGQRRFFCFLH